VFVKGLAAAAPDVVDGCLELRARDRPCLEPAAPEVAVSTARAIDHLCVLAVEVLHPARESRLCRLDDELGADGCQRDRMQRPLVPIDGLGEDAHERVAVEVVEDDEGRGDARRRDEEDSVRERRPKRARHAPTVAVVRSRRCHAGRSGTLSARLTWPVRPDGV
jgi:hypothetical protein